MTNDVALVVGVGPGLGGALARRFAAAGLQVACAARDGERLRSLAAGDRSGRLHVYPCDVAESASVTALFSAVGDDLGSPSLVVFNAGAYQRGPVVDIRAEDFERCWRVGCFGGFLVGQAAARLMLPQGRGTILFTGATASLRGSAGFVTLAMPKFGLRAVAQSLARELGPQGIHVAHVLIDGQIASERTADFAADHGPDSTLAPDAIAEAYWQLHRQERSAWSHEIDLRPWSERF